MVVSKLIRFHGSDRADISAMIEGNHVQHEVMLERLRSAIDRFRYDARCHVLPRIVERFNRVERDDFGMYETRIELPDDIDR